MKTIMIINPDWRIEGILAICLAEIDKYATENRRLKNELARNKLLSNKR